MVAIIGHPDVFSISTVEITETGVGDVHLLVKYIWCHVDVVVMIVVTRDIILGGFLKSHNFVQPIQTMNRTMHVSLVVEPVDSKENLSTIGMKIFPFLEEHLYHQ
jgi:hypothetical protein